MPKLKQSESAMNRTIFNATIAQKLILCGINKPELAKKMQMSRSTLYEKLRDPDRFTIGEVKRMAKALNFSDDERIILLQEGVKK